MSVRTISYTTNSLGRESMASCMTLILQCDKHRECMYYAYLHYTRLNSRRAADSITFYDSQRTIVKMLEHGVYKVALPSLLTDVKKGRIVIHLSTHDAITTRSPNSIVMPAVSTSKRPSQDPDILLVRTLLKARIDIPDLRSELDYLTENQMMERASYVAQCRPLVERLVMKHLRPAIAQGNWTGVKAREFAARQSLPLNDSLPLRVSLYTEFKSFESLPDEVRGRILRECFLCESYFVYFLTYF